MSAHPPLTKALTSNPLRNRIRLELTAPVADVWALIGDLSRFPEYSSGLLRVETSVDARGACRAYVCHFKAQEEGGAGLTHREIIHWYEPNQGFASVAEAGNVFGLTDALTLVTLTPSQDGTIMTWAQYYDAAALDMMKAAFDQALTDIGEHLTHRFGGSIVEHFIER